MITDVAGIEVGHSSDPAGRTGCTAVLLPPGTVASGEVRGGAPATREFSLLAPHCRVRNVHAVVLSGGSAFGLAAADGVMAWCEERGIGHPTSAGPVPIVVGMSLFDLVVGDPAARPGPGAGRDAAEAAAPGPFELGAVGAGTGARMGFDRSWAGGLVTASERQGDLVVAALVVVNAAGLPVSEAPVDVSGFDPDGVLGDGEASGREHTTIGVVATNARLDKTECLRVAHGAHDGLARAIDPPHTSVDGDAFVAAATGEVIAPVDVVRALAVRAVAAAIASVTGVVGEGPDGAGPGARDLGR